VEVGGAVDAPERVSLGAAGWHQVPDHVGDAQRALPPGAVRHHVVGVDVEDELAARERLPAGFDVLRFRDLERASRPRARRGGTSGGPLASAVGAGCRVVRRQDGRHPGAGLEEPAPVHPGGVGGGGHPIQGGPLDPPVGGGARRRQVLAVRGGARPQRQHGPPIRFPLEPASPATRHRDHLPGVTVGHPTAALRPRTWHRPRGDGYGFGVLSGSTRIAGSWREVPRMHLEHRAETFVVVLAVVVVALVVGLGTRLLMP
jgi:hypothetical protein